MSELGISKLLHLKHIPVASQAELTTSILLTSSEERWDVGVTCIEQALAEHFCVNINF